MSKSNYTLDAMISAANEYQQSLCDECWDRSELAKYYELEHEGRLVVLPCKVGDLTEKYRELTKPMGDEIETYTTGYQNGYKNGQAELLAYLLQIDTGTREAAEKALGGGEG